MLVYDLTLRGSGEGGNIKWRVNDRVAGRAILDDQAPLATGAPLPIPAPRPGASAEEMRRFAGAMSRAMGGGTSWFWLPVNKSGALKGGEPMHVFIDDEFVSREQDVCTKEWATATTTCKGDAVDRNDGAFRIDEDRANAVYNVEVGFRPKGTQSYTETLRVVPRPEGAVDSPPVKVPFSRIVWPDISDVASSAKIKHAKWQPLPADPTVVRFDAGWATPRGAAGINWPGADKKLKMRAYYQVTPCK